MARSESYLLGVQAGYGLEKQAIFSSIRKFLQRLVGKGAVASTVTPGARKGIEALAKARSRGAGTPTGVQQAVSAFADARSRGATPDWLKDIAPLAIGAGVTVPAGLLGLHYGMSDPALPLPDTLPMTNPSIMPNYPTQAPPGY